MNTELHTARVVESRLQAENERLRAVIREREALLLLCANRLPGTAEHLRLRVVRVCLALDEEPSRASPNPLHGLTES